MNAKAILHLLAGERRVASRLFCLFFQSAFRDLLRPLLACVPVVAQPGVTNHLTNKFFSSNDVNIQLNHVAEDDEAPSCHFIRIKQLYEILFAPSYY